MPRSYDQALAQRAIELIEIDAPRIEEAFFRVATLVSQPGGEVYIPLFDRLKAEWKAVENRRAKIREARAMAAGRPPKMRSRGGPPDACQAEVPRHIVPDQARGP